MGENVCIYVKKEQVRDLFFVAEQITRHLGNSRWYYFKEKFKLGDKYPNEENYWTADQIVCSMLGKEIKEEYVYIMKGLIGKDCIIQGDYENFPKGKNEEDYIDLEMVFYDLWHKEFDSKSTQKTGSEVER